MTTGEGGMITTNGEHIVRKSRMIRSHGQKERYFHEIVSYNCRMTGIAAAIGLCQLGKVEDNNSKRIRNARFLSERFGGIRGLVTPHVSPNVKHVFHQYTVRITKDFAISRDELRKKLLDRGIGTEVYYPLPVHKQPLCQNSGYNDHLPSSARAASEVLSLPVHPSVTEKDLEHVVDALAGYANT
jgi:perosamine synthetase